MPGGVGHSKRHDVDSVIDHRPVAGATGGNIVTIDPVTKLPINDSGTSLSAIIGGINIVGGWNAATNTPTLVSGVGTAGNGYVVTTPGTTNLDGENDWKNKDVAWFDGVASVWRKIDNTEPAHSDLVDLAWSDAKHILDTKVNIYYVDEDNGDDTFGDGSILYPYKTIQKAVTIGTATLAEVFIFTNSRLANQTVTVPAGKTVSVTLLSGVDVITGVVLTTVTMNDGSIFIGDNIDVQAFDDSGVTTNCTVFMENGEITNIPVANYTKTTIELHGTTMHPSTWAYFKASALSLVGNANLRGKWVSDDGFDANDGNIVNVGGIIGNSTNTPIESTAGDVQLIASTGKIDVQHQMDMTGGAGHWVRSFQMTTTQRDTMSAAWTATDNGKRVYNTTLKMEQIWKDTGWVNL